MIFFSIVPLLNTALRVYRLQAQHHLVSANLLHCSPPVNTAAMDDDGIKQLLLSFEKKINKNMHLRAKHADVPAR